MADLPIADCGLQMADGRWPMADGGLKAGRQALKHAGRD